MQGMFLCKVCCFLNLKSPIYKHQIFPLVRMKIYNRANLVSKNFSFLPIFLTFIFFKFPTSLGRSSIWLLFLDSKSSKQDSLPRGYQNKKRMSDLPTEWWILASDKLEICSLITFSKHSRAGKSFKEGLFEMISFFIFLIG